MEDLRLGSKVLNARPQMKYSIGSNRTGLWDCLWETYRALLKACWKIHISIGFPRDIHTVNAGDICSISTENPLYTAI